MSNKKIPAILDDRMNVTLGSMIKDCKTQGTPYMVVLGDKVEDGKVELEKTLTGEKIVITEEELIEKLEELNKRRLYKEYDKIKDLF